jgi:hypothetical protein
VHVALGTLRGVNSCEWIRKAAMVVRQFAFIEGIATMPVSCAESKIS